MPQRCTLPAARCPLHLFSIIFLHFVGFISLALPFFSQCSASALFMRLALDSNRDSLSIALSLALLHFLQLAELFHICFTPALRPHLLTGRRSRTLPAVYLRLSLSCRCSALSPAPSHPLSLSSGCLSFLAWFVARLSLSPPPPSTRPPPSLSLIVCLLGCLFLAFLCVAAACVQHLAPRGSALNLLKYI